MLKKVKVSGKARERLQLQLVKVQLI